MPVTRHTQREYPRGLFIFRHLRQLYNFPHRHPLLAHKTQGFFDSRTATTGTTANMAAETTLSEQLSERIHLALEPFTDSTNKPPFELEYLIAMALHSTRKVMAREEICRWLTRRSAFFADHIIDQALRTGLQVLGRPDTVDFRSDFRSAVHLYELAIAVDDKNRFSIASSAAVRYLDGVLRRVDVPGEHRDLARSKATTPPVESEANQANSIFWRLPPKLRVRIYELVFQYPISGLLYSGVTTALYTATRDMNKTVTIQEVEDRGNLSLLKTAPY
jgi:hypothetical protein